MMRTDIKILPMDSSLVYGVEQIECACFARPWSLEDITAQAGIDTSHFFVATYKKKAVGYIGVQVFCGDGYVTNIAVLPQYRRRGIAKALILKAEQIPMSFLSLEVRRSNAAAIALYKSMGFKTAGERKGFYTSPCEDALIMTKIMDKS